MKKVSEALLKKIARSFHTDEKALTYFGGGYDWSDGVLYEYQRDGHPCILKVMEMPAEHVEDITAALDARLNFVRFLGERGIGVVTPELSVEGTLYTEETEEGRLYISYTYYKQEGVHLFKTPWQVHDAYFVRWGEAMGKLHAAAKEYPVWYQLPEDPEGRILGWKQEWNGFYDWCKDEEVKASWRKVKAKLDALPVDRSGFGFTHNDLHIENMLFHEGNVTVLDFDVSNPLWFACDLAIAIYSIFTYAAQGKLEHPPQDPERLKSLYRAFIQGYQSSNHLETFWYDQLETFLQYRRILLFVVLSGELSRNNPEHYQTWRKHILEETPFPAFQ